MAILKENLTLEERIAITLLIESIRDCGVFVQCEDNPDWMQTPDEPLPICSLTTRDFDLCINALEGRL